MWRLAGVGYDRRYKVDVGFQSADSDGSVQVRLVLRATLCLWLYGGVFVVVEVARWLGGVAPVLWGFGQWGYRGRWLRVNWPPAVDLHFFALICSVVFFVF